MNCKNKVFSFLISLCSVGLSSVSNVAAKPGDFLVYFVGNDPNQDSNLSYKSCCKCGENLAERCLQFCCEEGCKKCLASNMSAYFNRANLLYRHSGCKHVKKGILEKIKSNGYFCFVDYKDNSEYAFLCAKKNGQLCCAYCIKKYLQNKYATKKGIAAKNLIGNKFNSGDECFICLQELKKTDELTYCKSCEKKVLHLQCASKWWNQNNSCPLCKSAIGMKCDESNIDCKSFNNIGVTENFDLPEYYEETEKCCDCCIQEEGISDYSQDEE